MEDRVDTYLCDNCGDSWSYFPEDYGEDGHHDICPFCTMPLSQMIKDIYREEGVWAVIKQIYKRYLKPMNGYFYD